MMVETPAPSTPEPQEPPEPTAQDVLVAAFQSLGYALSARALLLLALIGAFVIGVFAMQHQNWLSIITLGIYAGLTVLPVVWLEQNKRN